MCDNTMQWKNFGIRHLSGERQVLVYAALLPHPILKCNSSWYNQGIFIYSKMHSEIGCGNNKPLRRIESSLRHSRTRTTRCSLSLCHRRWWATRRWWTGYRPNVFDLLQLAWAVVEAAVRADNLPGCACVLAQLVEF